MINIIIQSYPEKRKDREKELLTVLRKNLENSVVKSVHNIVEPGIILPADIVLHSKHKIVSINDSLTKWTTTVNPDLPKFVYEFAQKSGFDLYQKDLYQKLKNKLKHRITYQYALDYANNTFKRDEIVCLLNADIILSDDQNWLHIDDQFFKKGYNKKLLILSRHEINESGNIYKDYKNIFKGWSNDAWCFKVPVIGVKDTNFTVGNCISCDNAIADRFWRAGYHLFNWANKYKIYHLDRVRKQINNQDELIMVINESTDLCYPAGKGNRYGRYICPMLNYDKYLKERKDPSMNIDQWKHYGCGKIDYEHTH